MVNLDAAMKFKFFLKIVYFITLKICFPCSIVNKIYEIWK